LKDRGVQSPTILQSPWEGSHAAGRGALVVAERLMLFAPPRRRAAAPGG
jgi:hypothetical protein